MGSGWAASWQAGLTELAARNYAKDLTNPTFSLPATRGELPRIDLPYGTTRWIGTSGDRGVRPRDLEPGAADRDHALRVTGDERDLDFRGSEVDSEVHGSPHAGAL